MSRFSHYGSGQRLAFAMMCVAICFCFLGAVVPFWMKSEIKMSDVSMGLEKEVPVVGNLLTKLMDNVKMLKINLGVWVFCVESVGSDTKCYSLYSSSAMSEEGDNRWKAYSDDNENSWIYLVRLAIAFNIKLSIICGIAACCRCMCCSGGKTICHGIFAFIAGVCGIFALSVMAARKDELVLGLIDLEYDWGFYIFGAGSGLMILASLFLCFSVPREMPNGMVMMQAPAAYVHVNPTNTNIVHAPVNQYELNGQIRSFEPLPDQTVFQNPPPPQY